MISSSRLSSYPIFSHKTPSIHYSGCLWGRRMKGHKKKITWNVVPLPFTRYVFPHVNHNWEQHESIWLRSESIHRTQLQKSQAEPYFNRTFSSHMFYFSFTDDGVFQRWYTLLPPSNSKEGERSLGSENRVTARPASLCIELDRSYFGSAVVSVRPVRRREGWGTHSFFVTPVWDVEGRKRANSNYRNRSDPKPEHFFTRQIFPPGRRVSTMTSSVSINWLTFSLPDRDYKPWLS